MRLLYNFRKAHEPLAEALEEAGCTLRREVWSLGAGEAAGIDAAVVNLYDAIRRPFDAYALKRRLAAAGAPLVAVDRDAPWHLGLRRRRIRLFQLLRVPDIYATHTLQPTYRFAPEVLYFPNAAWLRHFNLHGRSLAQMRDPAFYRWDVSFMGNMDGARYKEHAERERFFRALEPELTRLGLATLFRSSGGVPEAEQIEVIQRSRVNLNYRSSCDHGGVMSWGLPERCYGVPARGGFILSDARRHAADDFVPGREWADFRDMAECIARVRHFASHPEAARDIAEAAHARVLREHTYAQRAARLLAAIDDWRRRRRRGAAP